MINFLPKAVEQQRQFDNCCKDHGSRFLDKIQIFTGEVPSFLRQKAESYAVRTWSDEVTSQYFVCLSTKNCILKIFNVLEFCQSST